MTPTLNKLKQIAKQADDFPKFPIKIHMPSITEPLANYYNAITPKTVLALLELLELYAKDYDPDGYDQGEQAALIAKIEEAIK